MKSYRKEFRKDFSKELIEENDKMWSNLSYELGEEYIERILLKMPYRIFFLLHKDGYYEYSFIEPKNEYGVWKPQYKDIMVDVIMMSKEVSMSLLDV